MSQILFTIECRVDFRDDSKIPLFQKLMQQLAHLCLALGGLLCDGVKPQVVIYSHDYFKGHQDISLFEDDIANGEAIIEASNLLNLLTKRAPASAPEGEDNISSEVIAALSK